MSAGRSKNMATLVQIRDKANAKLATMWTELKTRQEAYFQKHRRYFQLRASSNLVADGVDTPFSLVPPSDEAFVVDLGGAWTDSVPFQIIVDAFYEEKKRGYTATVYIKLLNGDIYTRSRTLLDERTVGKIFDPQTGKRIGSEWVGTPTEIDTGWSQWHPVVV